MRSDPRRSTDHKAWEATDSGKVPWVAAAGRSASAGAEPSASRTSRSSPFPRTASQPRSRIRSTTSAGCAPPWARSPPTSTSSTGFRASRSDSTFCRATRSPCGSDKIATRHDMWRWSLCSLSSSPVAIWVPLGLLGHHALGDDPRHQDGASQNRRPCSFGRAAHQGNCRGRGASAHHPRQDDAGKHIATERRALQLRFRRPVGPDPRCERDAAVDRSHSHKGVDTQETNTYASGPHFRHSRTTDFTPTSRWPRTWRSPRC